MGNFNFDYDPDLIREAAEALVPSDSPTPCAAVRYQRAGIEFYAETYACEFMGEFEEWWEQYARDGDGNAPKFCELTNEQVHSLLASVALYHESADQAYFEDEWRQRIEHVFEDDIDAGSLGVLG